MSPSKKRGSINLTALGSAAVMAVYAAGYLRTRPAAQRYDGSDSQRRPVAGVTRPVSIDTVRLMDTVLADTLRAAVVVAPPIKKKPIAVPTIDTSKSTRSDSAPAHAPTDTTPVAVASAVPTTPPPAPDTARTTVDSVKVLKDGTYTGWGTSRHGDIQAAVEIKAGRIVNAYITQCLTRYSCSRIAAIIPQVVTRQSAEVDYVSGATQSTDAFYYAIVEALAKAK
jgi:uncharacterized protein with FMN-binding domain